jgi:hypothetical protein
MRSYAACINPEAKTSMEEDLTTKAENRFRKQEAAGKLHPQDADDRASFGKVEEKRHSWAKE